MICIKLKHTSTALAGTEALAASGSPPVELPESESENRKMQIKFLTTNTRGGLKSSFYINNYYKCKNKKLFSGTKPSYQLV